MESKKHIVIIGGGFAGLNFIKRMYNNPYYHITLVDRNNYNSFTPLLYQVATGFLEPSSISYPFRKLFSKKGILYRMGSVEKIDTSQNKLYLGDQTIMDYDLLVFAAGTKINFFGNDTIRKNAIALKGVDDAIYMRNELIKSLEKAAREKNQSEREKLLTIVIAGGGPTGVEVAGMLAEMRHYIFSTDYPELSGETCSIHLVDAAPFLLAPMSDKTHRDAYKILKRQGVEIELNTQVLSYENDTVELSNGKSIKTKTLIWAAGVTAATFEGISPSSLGKGQRMMTDTYNKVLGYENVYAIGDISIQLGDSSYPLGHPQLAQPAIQQGKTLAENLLRQAKGRPLRAFKYFDKGEMAIIGKSYAVADLFKHKIHVGGFLGLMSWLFIHLISLVNYNNIIKTFYNWTVSYLTSDQALRMIFRAANRENHN